MPKPIRYHIYPLWMWPFVLAFVALSFGILSRTPEGGVTGPSPADLMVALAPLLTVVCFLPRLFWTKNGCSCFGLIAILAVGVFLSMLLMPNIEAGRMKTLWSADRSRLKAIGIGLDNYEKQYGALPPVSMIDPASGTEKNWQTILFDGLNRGPGKTDFGHIPSDEEANSCYAVVGPNTAWPPDGRKVQAKEIADPGNTAIAIGICDPKVPRFGKETFLLLDDLTSGKISWEEEIAVYPYRKNRLSATLPSANLLMADGTLCHFVGVPTPEEIRWLFDIGKKVPNTLEQEPLTGRVYFPSCKSKITKTLTWRVIFRVWQVLLVMLFVGIFLPRTPKPDSKGTGETKIVEVPAKETAKEEEGSS